MTLRDMKLIDIPEYEKRLKELEETVKREQAARQDAVANEQKNTEAVTIERDTYKAQAEFYKAALEAATRKCGGARKFFHYVTLGLVACH